VETVLLDIIANGRNCAPDAAQEYLASMKKARRYQTDVY
jgi:sulfite reductase (NADPH) flavoprotein alpha-component